MSLGNNQRKFTRYVGQLIEWVYCHGYELTLGDAFAHDGHKKNSKHYSRLAVDLNLFKDGKYLTKTSDHKPLGEYWESLDPECVWGGRFNDGNHYQFTKG